MAFTDLYMHFVWSTKERKPLITEDVQRRIYPFMRGIVENLRAKLDAVNGTDDHVHMLARVPPALSASEFVQKVKSNSSRWAHENQLNFRWQEKYGAFSVNPREIHVVREYIATQKEHHNKVTYQDEFRRILDELGLPYDERYMWD